MDSIVYSVCIARAPRSTHLCQSKQVFHHSATKRKSTQVDRKSSVCALKLTTCSVRLASWHANLFGQTLQVRTRVLLLQTCVDLRLDSLSVRYATRGRQSIGRFPKLSVRTLYLGRQNVRMVES